MKTTLRAPAVPLVTVDPYFNVWSMSDHLYDDFTRHWTGAKNAMTAIAYIDGMPYLFAGKAEQNPDSLGFSPPAMLQTDLQVKPLSSTYTFEGGGVTLQADFTTPLLMDDLDLMSRPASYVTFSVQASDGRPHSVKIYFDITAEWCVNDTNSRVTWGRKELEDGIFSLYMGGVNQAVLGQSGDDVRIDWGYVNLAVPGDLPAKALADHYSVRDGFIKTGELAATDFEKKVANAAENCLVAACTLDMGTIGTSPVSTFLVLAYDDIKSVEYFGKPLDGYWKRNGLTFDRMLALSVKEYNGIMEKCSAFNEKLYQEALASGGEKYAALVSLAYRQAIAAHKLAADGDGRALFFSKENFSNGCMATVDVSYPSIPLFLLYNPDLIKGMMIPVFKFANTPEWKYDFAPHDAGRYPQANGQVYGLQDGELLLKYQMPIEECGNMLIMAAAVCRMEGKADFAAENLELLGKWAAYLKDNGLDPENQLCTDDFAGHLAHNANLSIKAIIALGAYSKLCRLLGDDKSADEYYAVAKEMAAEWELKAKEADHYRLTFDKAGTWSLKYNLIWDELLDLQLFAPEIKEKEVAYYLKKQNHYGIPLDSRNTYTKSDWLVWAAAMSDSKEIFEKLVEPLWTALHESPSRVPFTDWYNTVTSRQIGFQNRSVVGGIFIKLLKEKIRGRA